MPGLVPTNTQIRFEARMSTRGVRWAYFEGWAYLLDFFCFFGRWVDVGFVACNVVPIVVVRGRLLVR